MEKVQEVNEVLNKASTTGESKAGKYLTFSLAEEEYGLEILKVREIIGLMDITKVPQTPQYIRGVINLRGKVIPVLELRSKFLMESKEDTQETCIIVVDVAMNQSSIQMGILVDSVSEVLDIHQSQIEEPPNFGGSVDTNFILGMGKIKNKVKILLDIDKVLGDVDLSTISNSDNSEDNIIENNPE